METETGICIFDLNYLLVAYEILLMGTDEERTLKGYIHLNILCVPAITKQ